VLSRAKLDRLNKTINKAEAFKNHLHKIKQALDDVVIDNIGPHNVAPDDQYSGDLQQALLDLHTILLITIDLRERNFPNFSLILRRLTVDSSTSPLKRSNNIYELRTGIRKQPPTASVAVPPSTPDNEP